LRALKAARLGNISTDPRSEDTVAGFKSHAKLDQIVAEFTMLQKQALASTARRDVINVDRLVRVTNHRMDSLQAQPFNP